MTLELSAVPVDYVYKVAGGLAGRFEEAAQWSAGRCTATDILRMIMTGQYQLWVVFDKDTRNMHGFFATELRDYPQRRMLVVQHVVLDAHEFAQIESRMVQLFMQYAQETKCAGVEFTGRAGWKKRAAKLGFTERAVIFEKTIEATS